MRIRKPVSIMACALLCITQGAVSVTAQTGTHATASMNGMIEFIDGAPEMVVDQSRGDLGSGDIACGDAQDIWNPVVKDGEKPTPYNVTVFLRPALGDHVCLLVATLTYPDGKTKQVTSNVHKTITFEGVIRVNLSCRGPKGNIGCNYRIVKIEKGSDRE